MTFICIRTVCWAVDVPHDPLKRDIPLFTPPFGVRSDLMLDSHKPGVPDDAKMLFDEEGQRETGVVPPNGNEKVGLGQCILQGTPGNASRFDRLADCSHWSVHTVGG